MAFWPSVSISATSMLHPAAPVPSQSHITSPGRSCVTTSTNVQWSEEPSSKVIAVGTTTFGGRAPDAANRPFISGSNACLPFNTSAMLCWNRANFPGIQLQRAVQVHEVERIQHHPRRIRERIRLHDIHAPRREHTRNRCEQCRPVRRSNVSTYACCVFLTSVCTGSAPSLR